MSGSMRAELSSGALNGSNFASGYPNLDRPGSLREGLENRMVVLGPSAAQHLALEPFSTNELKNVRSGELRRILGISVEESSIGSSQSRPSPLISWEELKRFRGSVEETSLRARDRAKSLQDSILKLDRFRNIITKKRQRSEIQSNNLNLLKIGSQMHQTPTDLLGQRQEERTKNGVPSKRARSSMGEVRATSPYSFQPEGRNTLPGRQGIMVEKDKSILIDKDKNMLRACNGVPMPIDDKARGLPVLPVGGGGWDKKMKRKRSLGTMVNRTSDGDRELKQAMQQRNGNEPSPRSSDGLGFRINEPCRIGPANGITASNKMDTSSQLSAGSSRIIPRNEFGNGSISIDRRERSSGLDKERVTAKGSNKLNTCEDAQLGSQSPLTKGKGVRAPRTGSSMVMNSPSFPRPSGCIDGWEQSSPVSKVQHLTGTSNRKRPLPTGSSSPPVARWGDQRREKISRTRRANVVSPVSNFDETQADSFVAPDIAARLSSMESNGALFNRGIQNNSILKLKHENVPSPAALSESEESGAIENKSKEKGMDNSEVEDEMLNVAHRAATFVLPTKKNKTPLREEFGDGVRRQGRSGRGSMQSKASLQLRKETLEGLEIARPLKSGRLISDKTESRIGRPPSKKASERKVSSRPLQIINSSTCESDDDQEELLAAAKAVQNASSLKNSGLFWMLMEPIFAPVTLEDISLVKHQINFAEELDVSYSDTIDVDRNAKAEDTSQLVPSHSSPQVCRTNLVGVDKSHELMCSVDGPQPVKPANGKIETERRFEKIIPLSQRLLSAFISDEEAEMIDGNTKLGDTLEDPNDCSPYGTNSFEENEHGSEFTKFASEFDNDMGSQTNYYGDNTLCNGFASPSTTFRSPSDFISSGELLQENGHMTHPNDTNTGALYDFEQDKSSEQEPKSTALSCTSPNQCQYEHMSLDDKILMELHSIGIYPDAVPGLAKGDNDEIANEISELKIRLYEEAKKKKSQFCKLEKLLQEQKEWEMRNREKLAVDKLVEIAYKKLVGGRGGHGSSHKSGASKASKQLASAFAKRTLARVRKFEETGQSCFSKPLLRDVLFSEAVHGNIAKNIDGISSGIAPDLQNCQLGARGSVAASGVPSNIMERHGSVHQIDRRQLDPYQSVPSISEQALVGNDQISNRGKEVLLDDVVTGPTSRAMPAVNGNLPGGTKWKKIDKDHNRDILTKNSAPKGGTVRGERKTKAKPKQKIGQLSSSGNGIGRVSETTDMFPSLQESCVLSKDTEDSIFTNLPLQGIDSIDELDVTHGLGGQGEDIGSWLNVDDDALQDNDLVGLEIPMDDLSDLKLNF